MNKKAKKRIFDAAMNNCNESLKTNYWYQNLIRKTILVASKGKYRKTESEIIFMLTNKNKLPSWDPYEAEKLEREYPLMCGNPNV